MGGERVENWVKRSCISCRADSRDALGGTWGGNWVSETEVDLQAVKQRPPRREPVWRYPLMIMYVGWKLDCSRADANVRVCVIDAQNSGKWNSQDLT